VGKTELARQLAAQLGIALHRFDMTSIRKSILYQDLSVLPQAMWAMKKAAF